MVYSSVAQFVIAGARNFSPAGTPLEQALLLDEGRFSQKQTVYRPDIGFPVTIDLSDVCRMPSSSGVGQV